MKLKRSTAYSLHALMYMVRHGTQLPVTTSIIAKSEGIPLDYLAKVFQQLVKANFIKAVRGKGQGYVFVKSPEEITLLELFKVLEGNLLFDDCPLRHCKCGGTPENCSIFSIWIKCTKHIKEMLEKTTVAEATWNHPEHRFNTLPFQLCSTQKESLMKKT